MSKSEMNTSTITEQVRTNGEGSHRKYFRLETDMKGLASTPWFIWINEKAQRASFNPQPGLPFYGLQLTEVPKIAFDRTKRRGALRDAYTIMLGIWLISDRLKTVFERIDPDAFAFVRAEMDYNNFDMAGPNYWFCDIVRVLDCIDEQYSTIEYQQNHPRKNYLAVTAARMRSEMVGTAHAFRLEHGRHTQILDDVLVDAVKAEKLKGLRFVDLQ